MNIIVDYGWQLVLTLSELADFALRGAPDGPDRSSCTAIGDGVWTSWLSYVLTFSCEITMARSPDVLLKLFAEKVVVDIATIRHALGDVSAITAFRYLQQVPYRRSYNHNGSYYSLHDPSRYDRLGLWSFDGIHFSNDGSLKATVLRLVRETPDGATHRELSDRLRVRVHNTLLGLVRGSAVSREQVDSVYVYIHGDVGTGKEQLVRRQGAMNTREGTDGTDERQLPEDTMVIQVLLALIRHPGSDWAGIVRRLCGHSPPITSKQVQTVFTRYGLGEKGGPFMR